MLTINPANQNDKITFNAKLRIENFDNPLSFSNQKLNAIQDVFERNTKKIPGELKLISSKMFTPFAEKDANAFWDLKFTNNNFEDSIKGYMPHIPDTVNGIVKQLEKFCNIFKTRENSFNTIQKAKSELTTGSRISIMSTGMKNASFTNLLIDV